MRTLAPYAVILLFALAAAAEPGTEVLGDIPDPSAQPRLDMGQAAFLRERAEAGDAAMQCLYGLSLLNGSAGRTSVAEGEDWLRRSAEAGDARGMLEYGRLLYHGGGSRRDVAGAIRHLMPLAEAGNDEAAYYVGAALVAGEEVENDPELGERLLRRAAESGIVNAQADIGIAYYSGIGGLRRDYAEARRWFTLAAKQGNGDAANKLGVMYRNGLGVEVDAELAILWFTMGATLGDMYAQLNLANSYMNGEWVARDYAQAARWHEQAALRGNADSQYFMGCFFAEGIGVPRDPGRAREWLTLADRNGNAAAGPLLDALYEVDDGEALPGSEPAPVRVGAAELLREASAGPLPGLTRGRVLLLRLDDGVEISPAPESGAWFITADGCPGVIHCTLAEAERLAGVELANGMLLRALGTGFSGLPGFVKLAEAAIEDETAVPEGEGETEE